MPWRRSRAALVALALLGGAAPASAADRQVDLELLLAVDVSASVDGVEAALQRAGYVTALSDPAVLHAVLSGPSGAIAVTYVEWAGEDFQRTVIGWRAIDGTASALAFVADLAKAPISSAPYTSISALIDFGREGFKANGFTAPRRVIDISGDGPNNAGRSVGAARDAAVAEGITINGIPIVSPRPNPDGTSPAALLDYHYRRHVVGGPGAFLMEVTSFESFADTLVEKLLREIRGSAVVSARPPSQ